MAALSAAVAPRRRPPNVVEEPADASAFFDTDAWQRLVPVRAPLT